MTWIVNVSGDRPRWGRAVLYAIVVVLPGLVMVVQLLVADPTPRREAPIWDRMDQKHRELVQHDGIEISSSSTHDSGMGLDNSFPF